MKYALPYMNMNYLQPRCDLFIIVMVREHNAKYYLQIVSNANKQHRSKESN